MLSTYDVELVKVRKGGKVVVGLLPIKAESKEMAEELVYKMFEDTNIHVGEATIQE